MGTSLFTALAGMSLLALLLFIVGCILVGALVLYLSFRLVVGYLPSYLHAVGAALLTVLASYIVSAVLRMVMPMGLSGLFAVVVQLLIGAAVIKQLLLAQDGSQITYGKAYLVQLVNMLICIAVFVVVAVIMVLMFGSLLAHMH